MRLADFSGLASLVAVVDYGSFARASKHLGMSRSALSQSLTSLEKKLGVRLLNRTTRSVALTEAGQRFLAEARPALDQWGSAVEAINAYRDRPAGTLRLNTTNLAPGMVIAPILKSFTDKYPEIRLEIIVGDGSTDIVAGRFDAGIHHHWMIEKDMIATRVSSASRMVAIASPEYLANHPRITIPADLHSHNCIRFRQPTGVIAKWEFAKNKEKVEVVVDGSLISNNLDFAIGAAVSGTGVFYMIESYLAPLIAEKRLEIVLEDWAFHFSGHYIYYPSHRQVSSILKLLIDFLHEAMHRQAASASPDNPGQ